MEITENSCPLSGPSFDERCRVQRLSSMENALKSMYVHFFHQVNQSYSDKEKAILARISNTLSSLAKGILPKPCSSCPLSQRELAFWGQTLFFRLDLPAKDPLSASARLHCLQQLERRLHCFFVREMGSKPCSVREAKVIRRIKKIFVHELRNTDKYEQFKTKHVHRLSKEEKLELERQHKDEVRLKLVPMYFYNPLSEKYKKKKEEFLKELEAL